MTQNSKSWLAMVCDSFNKCIGKVIFSMVMHAENNRMDPASVPTYQNINNNNCFISMESLDTSKLCFIPSQRCEYFCLARIMNQNYVGSNLFYSLVAMVY